MTGREEFRDYLAREQFSASVLDAWYASRGILTSRPDRPAKGWDVELVIRGETQRVEEKYRYLRSVDHPGYPDILVEFEQDLMSRAPGWVHYCDARFLHYVLCAPTGIPIRLHRMPMAGLREAAFEHAAKAHTREWGVTTKGWGVTLWLAVPLDQIPDLATLEVDPVRSPGQPPDREGPGSGSSGSTRAPPEGLASPVRVSGQARSSLSDDLALALPTGEEHLEGLTGNERVFAHRRKVRAEYERWWDAWWEDFVQRRRLSPKDYAISKALARKRASGKDQASR